MKKTYGLIIAAALLSPVAALAGVPVDPCIAANSCNGNGLYPVPEPGTLALLAIGIAGLALTRRRKP